MSNIEYMKPKLKKFAVIKMINIIASHLPRVNLTI